MAFSSADRVALKEKIGLVAIVMMATRMKSL
jgi:hypothetical protein